MVTQCAALFYYVRCKPPESKRASLLSSAGKLCQKRVHASRIPPERIEACLKELRLLNPGAPEDYPEGGQTREAWEDEHHGWAQTPRAAGLAGDRCPTCF